MSIFEAKFQTPQKRKGCPTLIKIVKPKKKRGKKKKKPKKNWT
jgi:hypothetical protein